MTPAVCAMASADAAAHFDVCSRRGSYSWQCVVEHRSKPSRRVARQVGDGVGAADDRLDFEHSFDADGIARGWRDFADCTGLHVLLEGHFANCRASALCDLHSNVRAAAGRWPMVPTRAWARNRTRPTRSRRRAPINASHSVLSAAADGKVSAVHGADSPRRRRSGRAGEHRPHAPLGRLHGAGCQHRRGGVRGGEGRRIRRRPL